MKKVLGILIFTAIFLYSGNLNAQSTLKIGHIRSDELFAAMPESDSANKQLEREASVMRKTLEEINADLSKKYEDYMKLSNDPSTSALILSTKEEEMRSIQQRAATFEQQAQETLSTKQKELFQPIQEKAIKAVNQVATENGFTYIFDSAGGVLVYMSPDSQDILPLVKAKLGLK